jgi:hypothetical protein
MSSPGPELPEDRPVFPALIMDLAVPAHPFARAD